VGERKSEPPELETKFRSDSDFSENKLASGIPEAHPVPCQAALSPLPGTFGISSRVFSLIPEGNSEISEISEIFFPENSEISEVEFLFPKNSEISEISEFSYFLFSEGNSETSERSSFLLHRITERKYFSDKFRQRIFRCGREFSEGFSVEQ
jgi:hypothetical protein